ncbi:MAG: PD-(D/E)XK nuclease family protein [Collinsella sp.]
MAPDAGAARALRCRPESLAQVGGPCRAACLAVRSASTVLLAGCEDGTLRYGAYAEGAIDALATDPADPSRALVIDYKTGGTPDETPDQLLEKHALQARVYADVLHKAGFEAVTVKFVRVGQPDPTIFVEPAEPQVVTYNLSPQITCGGIRTVLPKRQTVRISPQLKSRGFG